jgi:hypothetical protein
MYTYRTKLARLFTAMSLDQAKATLGFRPNESPPPDEVNKAWRSLAFKNHPDRGGDPQKMVELNVAKDVLTGRMEADSYNPGTRDNQPKKKNYPAGWSEVDGKPKRWPSRVVKGTPFSKLKIPTGVKWLIATDREATAKEDNDWVSGDLVVLIGEKGNDLILTALFLSYDRLGHDIEAKETLKIQPSWGAATKKAPKSNAKKIRTLVRSALTTLKIRDTTVAQRGRAWVGGLPTESNITKIPKSGGDPLPTLIEGLGLIPEVKKIDAKVLLIMDRRSKAKPGYSTFADYDQTLSIDGRKVKLSDKTTDNLDKYGLSLSLSLNNPGGDHIVFDLINTRGGLFTSGPKRTLMILIKSLTSEPQEAKQALQAIVDSMA